MKNKHIDIKRKEPQLYYCNPLKCLYCDDDEKNCFINGGFCKLTSYKEFALNDENGNAIEYKAWNQPESNFAK